MPRKTKTDEKNVKSVRWEAIIRLINERPIATQQELADALVAEGFEVTQATVSRDIRDLHLVKNVKNGVYRYCSSKAATQEHSPQYFYQLYRTSVSGWIQRLIKW